MKVHRDGKGWHPVNAPDATFDRMEDAVKASLMTPAEAYSHEISVRTLATGERLLEWICEVKVRTGAPYTPKEREYVDRLVAARLEERRAKEERLHPPHPLDWVWSRYQRPGS